MIRLVRTAALATLVVLAGAVAVPAPASASDDALGWLRFTPAVGTIDDPVDALTQKACPGGEAVVVSVTGPRIPRSGDIGYIVGNTALSALPPTETGQLYVPLNLTFRDWFARNAPGTRPSGTYTVTLVCRDALRGSVTFGTFVGSVAIAKNGTYRALGASALPFDTGTTPSDELGAGTLPTAGPSSGGASPSIPSSAAPTSASTAAPSASSQQPVPSAATTSPIPGAAAPAAAADVETAGSGVRLPLLGLAAALLVGLALLARRPGRDPVRSEAQPDSDVDPGQSSSLPTARTR